MLLGRELTLRADVLVDVLLADADIVGNKKESTSNLLFVEFISQLSVCVKRIKRRVLFILLCTLSFCP